MDEMCDLIMAWQMLEVARLELFRAIPITAAVMRVYHAQYRLEARMRLLQVQNLHL